MLRPAGPKAGRPCCRQDRVKTVELGGYAEGAGKPTTRAALRQVPPQVVAGRRPWTANYNAPTLVGSCSSQWMFDRTIVRRIANAKR